MPPRPLHQPSDEFECCENSGGTFETGVPGVWDPEYVSLGKGVRPFWEIDAAEE